LIKSKVVAAMTIEVDEKGGSPYGSWENDYENILKPPNETGIHERFSGSFGRCEAWSVSAGYYAYPFEFLTSAESVTISADI